MKINELPYRKEIQATLERLKKAERNLGLKEKELRERENKLKEREKTLEQQFKVVVSYTQPMEWTSSVVRAFAHGAMGRRIDPSWGGPIELFLVPASAPRLV